MPTSEVECLTAWSRLRHRIIALQLEADFPKLADDSKQALTYVPMCLGGPGPSDSFWPERRRALALREEGLSLDEFILQESARCTRSPTREERETQQERELPFLRKLIDLTYEAYRKDWFEQGKQISPAFLRAVRQKVFAAVTLYLMEDEKLTKELLNTSCLHLPVGFAPARLARLLRRLPMSSTSHRRFQATDYINNLVKLIRAEALKLESVAAPPRKEALLVGKRQSRKTARNKGGSHTKKKNGQRSMARGPIAGKAEKRLDKELLPDQVTTNRRAMIDVFISKLTESERKITRKNIWSVAGYKDRTEFERFQRGDIRTTSSAAAAFNRVLNMSPEEFFRSLDKKLARK